MPCAQAACRRRWIGLAAPRCHGNISPHPQQSHHLSPSTCMQMQRSLCLVLRSPALSFSFFPASAAQPKEKKREAGGMGWSTRHDDSRVKRSSVRWTTNTNPTPRARGATPRPESPRCTCSLDGSPRAAASSCYEKGVGQEVHALGLASVGLQAQELLSLLPSRLLLTEMSLR